MVAILGFTRTVLMFDSLRALIAWEPVSRKGQLATLNVTAASDG